MGHEWLHNFASFLKSGIPFLTWPLPIFIFILDQYFCLITRVKENSDLVTILWASSDINATLYAKVSPNLWFPLGLLTKSWKVEGVTAFSFIISALREFDWDQRNIYKQAKLKGHVKTIFFDNFFLKFWIKGIILQLENYIFLGRKGL